jgi:hypothetical protein
LLKLKSNKMTKYTIREDANYGEVLQKNGRDAICPFQSPTAIPIQNQFGQQQIGFNRMPCSTLCPFACIGGNDSELYIIDCIGNTDKTVLELTKEEKEPELHIIGS